LSDKSGGIDVVVVNAARERAVRKKLMETGRSSKAKSTKRIAG